jgi:PAS domain S-box-containing protein
MATDFGALLADPLPDVAIVTAAEGTLLHWNKGAKAPIGDSSAEALGRSLRDLIASPACTLNCARNGRRGIDDR